MRLVSSVGVFLVFSISLASGFSVDPPNDQTLATFVSNINYESIQFQKRSKNSTDHIPLTFKITDLKSKQVELKLFYNDRDAYMGNAGDSGDVYAEKKLNSNGELTEVVVHLKNNAVNAGEYKLVVKYGSESKSAVAKLLSAPVLPVYSKPKRILQQDPIRISCRASGYPTPVKVEWLFAPIAVELSDDKAAISDASSSLKPINVSAEGWAGANFTSEDGTPNDTLRFSSITVVQNGLFACKVSNDLGSDSTFLLVGVKDRWAALWPFVGIVVEVCVLVTAILLYERHQVSKKPPITAAVAADTVAPAADAAAASPNGNASDKGKPDDVRLRNARS